MPWAKPGLHTQALTNYEASAFDDPTSMDPPWLWAHFQDGPIAEFGVNGTTNEEVIEMLLERLHSLNDMEFGRYRCRENSLAITHLEEALLWLKRRTENRTKRGVEGTHTP